MTGPVLVVVDGSDVANHALDTAIAEASSTSLNLVCLVAYPPRLQRGRAAHFDPEPEELDIAFADEVLDAAVRRAEAAGVTARAARRVGRPVVGISAEAEECAASLVVIGRRPRLPGLDLPDLTAAVSEACSSPVRVVDLPAAGGRPDAP